MAATQRRLRALRDHVRSLPGDAGGQPGAILGAAPCTNRHDRVAESDSIALRSALREYLPIPVDGTGTPDPAALAALRQAMHEAAAREDYQLAKGFSELLFVAEPRPALSLEECVGGETAEEKAAFFVKHGCIVS